MKKIKLLLDKITDFVFSIGSLFACSYWDDFADPYDDESVINHRPPAPTPTKAPLPVKVTSNGSMISFTHNQVWCLRRVGKHRISILTSTGVVDSLKVFGTVKDDGTARVRSFGHAGVSEEPELCHLQFENDLRRFGTPTNQ